MVERYKTSGYGDPLATEAFDKQIAKELAEWKKVVTGAGLRLDESRFVLAGMGVRVLDGRSQRLPSPGSRT